jgi:sulfatase modifying factor 1
MHLRSHRERNTTSRSCEAAHADKVWIPGGTFRMGSEEFYVEESPVHEVSVDSFWIDRYQVTNEQFARFVAEAGYLTVAECPLNPADFPGAPDENLVPGSMVFQKTKGPVDLRNYANWRWTQAQTGVIHVAHPKASKAFERHPAVHVAYETRRPMQNGPKRIYRPKLNGNMLREEGSRERGSRGVMSISLAERRWPTLGRATSRGKTSSSMAGNVWEWTADWYVPRHADEVVKPCCGPTVNPRIVSPAADDRYRNEPHRLSVRHPPSISSGRPKGAERDQVCLETHKE